MTEKEFFAAYREAVDAKTSALAKEDEKQLARSRELSAVLNGNFARFDLAVAGIAGEAGEVADLWKKVKYHGIDFDETVKNEMIKELGDVMWYITQASVALDIPLEEIINRNLLKLQQRHAQGFSADYMKNRKEPA